MKKYIVLLGCLLIVSGCKNTTTNYIFKEESMSGIHLVEYHQLQEMIDEKETFLLYIGRDDCLDCISFYPVLESFINENEGTYIYYLNILEYRNSATKDGASKEEITFYESLQDTFEFDWVPSIKMISDGKIIDHYQYLDSEYYRLDKKEQEIELERQLEYFHEWILQWYQ